MPALPDTVDDPGAKVKVSLKSVQRAGVAATIFIHPRSAIQTVPALYKACGGTDADAHVEALAVHVPVEVNACVVLAVRDSVRVMLQNVEYHPQHGALLHHLLLGNRRFGIEKQPWDMLLQYFNAVGNKFGIVLKSLQEPPTAVTAVVSWTVATVEKIGKQAVPKHGRRCHKDAASVLVAAGGGDQTAQ